MATGDAEIRNRGIGAVDSGAEEMGGVEIPAVEMDDVQIRAFVPDDRPAVLRLWQRCGLLRPWNDPEGDIDRKLGEQPDLFLVGVAGGEAVATAMAGFDGHRAWVYYVAVAPEYRSRSHGRRLMTEVERLLLERGCPKVNLQVRRDNLEAVEFYRRLGYDEDEVVSLGKRLIDDTAR